jgi:hypothetical protein
MGGLILEWLLGQLPVFRRCKATSIQFSIPFSIIDSDSYLYLQICNDCIYISRVVDVATRNQCLDPQDVSWYARKHTKHPYNIQQESPRVLFFDQDLSSLIESPQAAVKVNCLRLLSNPTSTIKSAHSPPSEASFPKLSFETDRGRIYSVRSPGSIFRF